MRRNRVLAPALAAVALAAAGCGSSSVTHTVTAPATVTTQAARPKPAPRQTVTATTTAPAATTAPARPPAPANAGYASSYSLAFEASFTSSCEQSGGTYQACGCALRHIEQAVPVSTYAAQIHNIAIGEAPSWFTAAIAACEGQ